MTYKELVAELDRANELYVEAERGADDGAFDRVADARLDLEDALLDRQAETLDDLLRQIMILKRRAAGGLDVTRDVARIAAGLLEPGSLSDR